MRQTVVIAGGGWGGVAAALAAARGGAAAVLVERTDMLLGTGLVGGIYRNNGRYTAAEEMLAMGGGELFSVMDSCARHKNIAFPGHAHANLYDVYRIEPAVRRLLLDADVEIVTSDSVNRLEKNGARLVSVTTRHGRIIPGDAFVDATGTSAVPANCVRHGNGCAMCMLRCHSFTPRVSLTTLAGVEEWDGVKSDGSRGAMSGSCKLFKESLAPHIVSELETRGVAVIPIPKEASLGEKLGMKACQQYATPDFADNIILLDTGPAKLMTPYFPLEKLRQVSGFEEARYEDPISGGLGNSMRYFQFAACTADMRACGVDNLFCAGERSGAMVGHTEAVVTGALAGHNAARVCFGAPPLVLPQSLAVGDFVSHVTEQMKSAQNRSTKYTFSGSVYFERMKELGLYTTDREKTAQKIDASGLGGVMGRPVRP